MVAEPESVPAVRRFVDDVLTEWGHHDLAEDVGLSVTELATNAMLHSRAAHFDVELHGDAEAVRLAVRPAALLLAHDDNLADIARELRLFGASHAERTAVAAAEEIVEVVRASAISWDAARLQAKQSLAEGRDTVDIAIAVSDAEELPGRIAALRRAVGMAESMSEKGLLITMAAPAPVQEWRDWVEAEMLQQTASARTPVPFADFRG